MRQHSCYGLISLVWYRYTPKQSAIITDVIFMNVINVT
jgi:hypothetical protein